MFALGYKPDVQDSRDYGVDRLLRRAGPAPFAPVSLMPYRKDPLSQGGAGSCVAHAIARAIDMGLRYELARTGRAGVAPPRAARRDIYRNARQQEVVEALARGLPAPPIADSGCFPRLAMRAVQKLGFVNEDLFPYRDDPASIAELAPPRLRKLAYDQSGLAYYRVPSTGAQRVADVSAAMRRGRPVIFGMYVDTAFMRNRGDVIAAVDMRDPNGGGHMLTVLEVTESEVIFDNWWDSTWGYLGVGRMTHDLFGSNVIGDVYAVESVPTFI